MLHWLAGAKPPDGPGECAYPGADCRISLLTERETDHDTSAVMEAPETPAPVFAVRAFKHAIFGTPQQSPSNARRHSTTERERHRPSAAARSSRPQMTRPKSAGDAAALGKPNDLPDPIPSPTKGILMTPGTAAARRKTVTFGDHVVDNEKDKVKEGSKTGLPKDFPGKFPSPWAQPSDKTDRDDSTPGERKRGRSKLTEDLHKAREESAKRKIAEANDHMRSEEKDFEEPDSESGKYWKREYDVYRANTTREVKKLVTKQKAAKAFAREKDMECTELSDELRQEKKKVERLEKRTTELEAQLKALQVQLGHAPSMSPTRTSRAANRRSTQDETDAPSPTRPGHLRSRSTDQVDPMPNGDLSVKLEDSDVYAARATKPAVEPQAEATTARTRVRHQPGSLPTDLWSRSLASSGPPTPSKPDLHADNVRNGRAVTSGTNLTPLKSLSINSQQMDRRARQERASAITRQTGIEQNPSRYDQPTAPPTDDTKDVKRCDSLDLDSADPPAKTTVKETSSAERLAARSSPLLPSSPFEVDAKPYTSSTAPTSKPLPARPASTNRATSKENVSPSRAAHGLSNGVKEGIESLHAPRGSAVSAATKDKEGRIVSAERIAAAKARMAARGRNVP